MANIVVGLVILTTIVLGWWLVKGAWLITASTFALVMQLGVWIGPVVGVIFCLWLTGKIVNTLIGK